MAGVRLVWAALCEDRPSRRRQNQGIIADTARFTRRFARFIIEVFFAAFLRLGAVRAVLRFLVVAGFLAAFLRFAMWPSSGCRDVRPHCIPIPLCCQHRIGPEDRAVSRDVPTPLPRARIPFWLEPQTAISSTFRMVNWGNGVTCWTPRFVTTPRTRILNTRKASPFSFRVVVLTWPGR